MVIKALAVGIPLVILHHGRDQAANSIRDTSRVAEIAVSRKGSTSMIGKATTRVLD